MGFYLTCPAAMEWLIFPLFVFSIWEAVLQSDALRDLPSASVVWWEEWSQMCLVLYLFACFIRNFQWHGQVQRKWQLHHCSFKLLCFPKCNHHSDFYHLFYLTSINFSYVWTLCKWNHNMNAFMPGFFPPVLCF